ncbi:serine/threonine protein kinase [Desulfocapsa sulfexigens DSM 10523]|uniref:non-specific serine/threonine protein kinase n=1 Tax=Desulfocapsa sulfexigens (strain DSM 10523 / SB164P1) TaxID=1167006 RepID=M1PS81_DESSD|nr:serine/threonine-protein kinase [Desulfocapsa sulfexigens]AGF79221.1 serine/threonine protein kinase [Desulfocapsa sulfexigens DSM 10523]
MKYGRYEIVSELGRGAMGKVYQAHDPQINRMVALKVLREDRLTTEDYVQRFLKEATAIGRLSHPGIVTVYDIGQDHGTIYIAMEFLEGQSMDQLVKAGNLSLTDIVDIGIQIAQALHYAHTRGIIHRDIKPPNIICTPENILKVTDFGIAHIDDPDGQQMTRAGEILGTPVYMAPEQVMGQTVDGRSDLYSLGVILYELTTGHRPFKGENLTAVFRAITQDDPVPPDQLNPDIPPALSKLILKAMARKPEDRFRSGQEMSELLGNCLNVQSQESFSETIIQTAPEKRRSYNGFMIATALLFCGAALVAYLTMRPPTADDVQQQKNTAAISEQPSHIAVQDEETTPVPPVVLPSKPEEPLAPIYVPSVPQSSVAPTPVISPDSEEASPVPDAVPEIKKETLQAQRVEESFDDLFTDDRENAPIFPSTNEPETATKPASLTKVELGIEPDGSLKPSSPITPGTVVASLPPIGKEENSDIQKKITTLQINSSPSGASLYIDGNYHGLTPLEIEVTAIKHEVKLELQGHLNWQAQLNLSKGGLVPLSISLLPE